ncbi:hypothetical protein PIIN_07805 [Serendipita indica DSM 11827]|uniref:Uncharacterized protein n=1 Tax=Serendipita indica (strain DSM 11827) TaxID=1109443 RepID=G4TRA8_SERID|nr:hypothetical protein PIIN_07805 [Serendipita indica DSM 11827]
MLHRGISYPLWAIVAPIGTTWSPSEASENARLASISMTRSKPLDVYATDSSDFEGSSLNEGWTLSIVLFSLAYAAGFFLLFVGLAWCIVLCIIRSRQRDRKRLYDQMASRYPLGGAVGSRSQTFPLMQDQQANPQLTPEASHQSVNYLVEEDQYDTQSKASGFAGYWPGSLKGINRSTAGGVLSPGSPLQEAIEMKEGVNKTGRRNPDTMYDE